MARSGQQKWSPVEIDYLATPPELRLAQTISRNWLKGIAGNETPDSLLVTAGWTPLAGCWSLSGCVCRHSALALAAPVDTRVEACVDALVALVVQRLPRD